MYKPFHDQILRYAERKSQDYATRYIRETGLEANPEIAECVRLETKRRAVMGYMLDLLEPAVWQGIAITAAAGLAAGQKLYANHRDAKETHPADYLLPAAFAALGSAVNFGRLWMRYHAGIEGGYDVALHAPRNPCVDAALVGAHHSRSGREALPSR